MDWYYVHSGQQAGPVNDAGLNNLEATGKITPNTLVWHEGMANWQPYHEVRTGATELAQPGLEEAVCAECGGMFPFKDTFRIGTTRVCARCKPIFVQKIREGVTTVGSLNYAGFWIRFAALFIDGLILSALYTGLDIAVFGASEAFVSTNRPPVPPPAFLALIAFEILFALSYQVFMLGKYGATLGKMACKIQVITANGGKISYLLAFGRCFAQILSYLPCSIGYIMAGFDEEKRALHDRICNTRVVYK